MPLPIPRLVWPITITAGANDLLPFSAKTPAGSYPGHVAVVPAGEYLTPESLLAAVSSAVLSAADASGDAFSVVDGGFAAGLSVSGFAAVMFSGVDGDARIYWSAPPPWSNGEEYSSGTLVATSAGRIYLCTGAGLASGATEPTGETSSVTDGDVTWAYKGRTSAAQGLARTLGFAATNRTEPAVDGFAGFGADHQMPNLWTPDAPARFATYDREQESIVTQVETAGGQTRTTRWTPASIGGRRKYGRLRFEWLEPHKVFAADATGDKLNQALETFWHSPGVGRFRYSPDRTNPATGAADLVVRASSLGSFKPERVSDAVERFHFEFEVMRYLDASGNESP